MKLRDALKQGLFTLTDLEKKSLNCIRNQGSFYEEGMRYNENDELEFVEGQFFGWKIYESEVKGCRGAISSLVKKGILNTDEDDEQTMYFINYELEFDSNNKYKILFD